MEHTIRLTRRNIKIIQSDDGFESAGPIRIEFTITPPIPSGKEVKLYLKIDDRFGGASFSLPSGERSMFIEKDSLAPFEIILKFDHNPFKRYRPYIYLELSLSIIEHGKLSPIAGDFAYFKLKHQIPS